MPTTRPDGRSYCLQEDSYRESRAAGRAACASSTHLTDTPCLTQRSLSARYQSLASAISAREQALAESYPHGIPKVALGLRRTAAGLFLIELCARQSSSSRPLSEEAPSCLQCCCAPDRPRAVMETHQQEEVAAAASRPRMQARPVSLSVRVQGCLRAALAGGHGLHRGRATKAGLCSNELQP